MRSTPLRKLRILTLASVPLLAGGAALVSSRSTAHAEDATEDKAERNERCAVRISMALLGDSPAPELATSSDPQAGIDAMVRTPVFIERFARFINSEVSGTPSDKPGDDPVYFLAHHVLTQDKPWSDLFIGRIRSRRRRPV
jgi:hypothetical protein